MSWVLHGKTLTGRQGGVGVAPRNSVSPIWRVTCDPQRALHTSGSSPSPQNVGGVGGLPEVSLSTKGSW